MIDFRSPYTPGAGAMPKYLAGREEILEQADRQLRALNDGYQTRNVVLYGLRGVGKTVLLCTIENSAIDEGVLVCHLEVEEKRGLINPLASACSSLSQTLSKAEFVKSRLKSIAGVFSSLSLSVGAEDGSMSFGLDEKRLASALSSTENLSGDLTDIFVCLGKIAHAAQKSICFCIDELQYAKQPELGALVCALHRVSQLGLPIVLYCAGLPKLLKQLGDAKTYTERLFRFEKVDSLDRSKALDAIVEPAKELGVFYEPKASEMILDYTGGYPYFIQELCSTIWDESEDKLVTAATVARCEEITNSRLDEGFFSVRYSRCTMTQREFLIAMVRCGELPCSIACVAKNMGRETSSISPFRAQLISKGLIYSTGRGEVDFTVPHFDRYIVRTEGL